MAGIIIFHIILTLLVIYLVPEVSDLKWKYKKILKECEFTVSECIYKLQLHFYGEVDILNSEIKKLKNRSERNDS